MENFIEVTDLTKSFTVRKKREKGSFFRQKEEINALNGVSFSIGAGELVGYIGPNGAGKSTTVKLLSGILTPESGTVLVDGRVPWKERKEHVRHIGVVFGQRTQLWWDVPVIESYALLRDIYRLDDRAYRARLDELTGALSLSTFLKTPLRQLSLGQRMRAEVAGSLLHTPKLLFLDEPTIGLDAVSKLALRDFLLRENRAHGTTVLLTTHDMEDIKALCPRVMVLGHGKLLYDGALSELLSRYDTVRCTRIRYQNASVAPALPACCQVARDGADFLVSCPHDKLDAGAFIGALQSAGHIEEMTLSSQNIDQMIAAMYREMAL